MKQLLALVLILAFVFAAGLRIDFDALAEKLHMKSDPKVERFLKMGIDLRQIGYQGKPWWTFRSEDNLFLRFEKASWNRLEGSMAASLKVPQKGMQKERSSSPEEILDSQAEYAAAQVRHNQLKAEAGMQDEQQESESTPETSQGAEEPET